MGKQPTDDLEAVRAGGRGSDPCRPGDGVVTRARKRPRGFYARLARARGVSLDAVYRKLNSDKPPSVRARHECDASPPWDPRGGKIKPRDEGDVWASTLWRRIKDGAVKGGAHPYAG